MNPTKIDVNNPCCICGGARSDLVFETTYAQYRYPGTFAMRRCRDCGLLFNSPRLPDHEFPRLYDQNYYFFDREDPVEFKRIIAMYRRTLRLLDPDAAKSSLLEIGSAKGYLLAVLKRMGFRVQGVEISAAAAASAGNTFDIPCFVGTLEDYVAGGTAERFTHVLAIDLIEHVLNPPAFARALGEVVEDDGFLVVDTPNGAAVNIEQEKETWGGFNPFHIYAFTPETIRSLLEAAGFTIERIFSYGNTPPENRLETAYPVGPRERVMRLLRKAGLYEPLKRSAQRIRTGGRDPLDAHLASTVAELKKESSYFDSLDSRGPAAAGCRGDNLVILARRNRRI